MKGETGTRCLKYSDYDDFVNSNYVMR